ncbi:MAG TPA: amidohydrolase family protein [Burkholderiaceae bacterium]|nr:amidohydrolase family protein [Burkholderiaceae bacterium]
MIAEPLLLRNARPLLGEGLRWDGAPRDLLIEDGRIAAIEPAGVIGAQAAPAGRTIDLAGRLLVPGMINGHFHSHEAFQKGRTENLPLELWMHYVRTPIPVPLTREQAYLRAMIGALEALRSGATAVVDDMSLGGAIDEAVIDGVLSAYDDLGIRAFLGFAMMDRPVIDNFPFVDELVDPALVARLRGVPRPDGDALLALTRRLASARHPRQSRVSVIASASAPQRCTPAFLQAIRALADELSLPVIIHAQETRLQVVTGRAFFGSTMIERLHALGFLKPATTLIHAVWLNPREIALLAQTGATAQHNAWSNLMLGSGVMPVRELLDAGVNVSIGTDGCCSTVNCNMLNAVGTAAALSKVRGADYRRWLTAHEACSAATMGGARGLGQQDRLGAIEPGRIADLVAYRLDALPFVPLSDPLRQLVYAERGAAISDVFVDGEPVMRNGLLTRVDEAALIARIGAAFAELEPRFREAEASVAPMHAAMETIVARCEEELIADDTWPARIGGRA